MLRRYLLEEAAQLSAAGVLSIDLTSRLSQSGGMLPGILYELTLTATNGPALFTQRALRFVFDETPPLLTQARATICPESGALFVEMRPEQGCHYWPDIGFDVPRQQANADRIALRWKDWLDWESDIVQCTFSVLDVAGDALVHTEEAVPCNSSGTYEISGLALQHGHSYKVRALDVFTTAHATSFSSTAEPPPSPPSHSHRWPTPSSFAGAPRRLQRRGPFLEHDDADDLHRHEPACWQRRLHL